MANSPGPTRWTVSWPSRQPARRRRPRSSRRWRRSASKSGPRLRADRDIRALHRLRVAARMARLDRRTSGAGCSPGRGRMVVTDGVRVVDPGCNDVPKDGETLGEVVMRGNNVMTGYFHEPGCDRHGVPGRVVPQRGPGRVAPRWVHRTARPGQRHHRLRRREHLDDRGGGRHRLPPRGLEVAVVACRATVGRASQGDRVLPGAQTTRGVGDHRALPPPHRALQVPGGDQFGDLPKTSTGKIQKFELRNKEWGGREKRIN